MPTPFSACRFAAHWVADALAGDEALDFSLIKALVGVLPESLAGAPEETRERVALRCLQEVVSLAGPGEGDGEGEAAAAAAGVAGGGTLRVDATRSCEELLIELLGQVGTSGSLEKDMLLPFSKDIQKFICIKTPALPETSFELLREVNTDITCMVPPPPVEKGGKNNGIDQSLCSINPDHDVNAERHGCPTDSSDLQRESVTDFVSETFTRNVQKDPMVPTPDFHEPSMRCYDRPQEDTIGVGVSVRSAQTSPSSDNRNMPITAEPASATCSAALLRGNTGLMSKQVAAETTMSQEKSPTTILQQESCGDKYKNSFHDNDGERSHGNGTNIHLSKNLSHEGLTMQATVAPDSDRSTDALLATTSETRSLPEFVTVDGTGVIAELHGRKTRRSSLQHDSSEKASHVLDEGSARIETVEKDSGHNERNLRTAGVVPSVSCNGAVQGDKSETNLLQENATGPSTLFKEKKDKVLLEVSFADKANPALHDDGNILENNTSYGRKTALVSPCCNATSNVHRSNDSPSGFAAACLLSLMFNMPSCSQDKDANGSTQGFTEQDLCITCGKDGQLLKCSSCSLVSHESCFGSSVTFDVSGQFYCPVCFYTKASEAYQKAKKTYLEARKNLSAFLGTQQFPKEHHEQSTGKQQTATNSKDHSNEHNTSKRQGQSEADDLSHKGEEPGEQREKQRTNDTSDVHPEEGQLNGCDASKRQGNHQSDTYNLSHKDLEPGQQRKKQKTNATSGACPEGVITEKASFGLNCDIAPNKDCVLENKRKQVEQSAEGAEAHEDGNGNSFYAVQHSSQNRCSPVANQSVEAEKHDSLTNSHDPKSSDEIEATSSNNSGKRSSPPWRNMRHHKARFQEKETVVSCNSKKALRCQDQQMPSPSSKQYQHKRYIHPLAPPGRRPKLCWTEEEEQALRDAMLKFTPKDDAPIPWTQILEYGKDTFHRSRLASDLRVKWRNMKKKSGS
ncbi:hypothetical protein CFC21_037256 [Triticum aestivum]|uniref:Myb-like domain-containing protein n=4 Tax=Triticum TaxID=4564 RepID=A0A9R0VQ34_TRITD|nr:uncharacterized protein LOC123062837 isoform X1 [Triticum aestivum]KAF7025002.1 hypothetical protein CFC21_037256 [Triticum aestivum]VAH66802.1 unnamed protein product [Triticum turgidum subsp. durum]